MIFTHYKYWYTLAHRICAHAHEYVLSEHGHNYSLHNVNWKETHVYLLLKWLHYKQTAPDAIAN